MFRFLNRQSLARVGIGRRKEPRPPTKQAILADARKAVTVDAPRSRQPDLPRRNFGDGIVKIIERALERGIIK